MKAMSVQEAVEFIKSLGEVEIVTPQFERTDGITPVVPEGGKAFFDTLPTLPHETLKAIGMGLWDEGHYLYPGEWYDSIPDGYPVVTVNGAWRKFIRGETDDDIRFGCLAYGFKRSGGAREGING